MQIADHLEKLGRLDAARAGFDTATDAEMWFWTTVTAAMQAMNAGLHAAGCTVARDDFATPVIGVYEVPSGDGRSFARRALAPGDLHLGLPPLFPDGPAFIEHPPLNPPGRVDLGIPAFRRPLPDALQQACRAVEVIEEVRDPSIRGLKPITPELVAACDRAYAELMSIVRDVVARGSGGAA
jgi:hypothetical protein